MMFKCDSGSSEFHAEEVSEIFRIDDRFFLVEKIPAIVCDRCAEETFSRETTERIRLMLHGESKPIKSVSVDVFAYQPELKP